jgi:large subunit ribosomal protein L4e
MQATVHTVDGETDGEIDLPAVFETTVRTDLVRRAVLAAQANRKQDYGADEFAGLRTPAESFGSGRGMAHVPREGGSGKRVPQTVGGRPAHPPKPEKDRSLSINDKERRQAIESAIAATADADLVRERGHAFDDDVELPLVVADEFEELEKTQAALEVVEELGLAADIERAEETTVRAGQGTTRGRKRRRATSILFVTSEEPSRAARNLAGADVRTASELDAEILAPGTDPGRLTLWTESAIAEVDE